MTEKTTFIPARLKSSVVGGHVAGTADIIDDAKGKTQDVINEEVESSINQIEESIGSDSSQNSVKGRIKALETQVGSGNVDEKINNAVDTLNGTISRNKQDADSKIDAIKGGSSKSIQNLSDEIATKQPTLTFDNAPELGSGNPVKSDGIKKALNEKVDKVEGKGLSPEEFTALEKEKLGALPNNADLQQAINSKQDNLEFENTPSDGSTKIVRSGGIKSYVDGKVNTEELRAKASEQTLDSKIEETNRNLQSEITRSTNKDTEHDSSISTLNSGLASEISRATGKENEIAQSVSQEETRARAAEEANANGISGINAKIPSEASEQNQLADKAFVNSSVATNTANYISNGGEPFDSIEALNAYSGVKTNNDYAFVKTTDAAGNTVFKRYKYNASLNAWALEYELNNSSFTAVQWAAINSGITLLLTNKLIALPTMEELTALLLQKQDVISDLATIRQNAQTGAQAYQKPQAGIPSEDMTAEVRQSLSKADSALQQHQSLENYYTKSQADNLLAGKQDSIADLADIREGAAKGATALQEHQSLADYYNKSQVDGKLAQKQETLTIDQTPTVNSNNPISSDAVYDLQEALVAALNGKQAALTFDNMPTSGSGNPVTSGGVHAAIANSSQIRFVEVENLPEPSEETLGKIYVIKESATSYQWYVTVYDQELVPAAYVWRLVNNNSVDLSDYYTIAQVDALLAALATVATTGSFTDLVNLPTTLAGYGITDVKIENGVITIGGVSITPLTEHQDISGKAEKSEMSITPGTDADADKTTIQLKSGLSATVLTQHQDISGKQDVLDFATDAECESAANELT